MNQTQTATSTNTSQVPLSVKIRRRIEDRLRKDEQAVLIVAEVLKIKVTE
jgi:hypothetical protein